ncbi:ribosomal protein L7/L12 [Kineosphaera limosa]|uniref:Large ribosomal subunit protein bL12 C-terminal domain-containing protein n=1 Tax=Kineosphaera limosa NBRC 100340 TaxID=1184609 RepID=K6WTL0_9MICO|nr:ribosomal protein L7/L12 [Kineosphaera limosa]NYE02613.1 ribosomal protein L7/L12 [Kineosphaera limosa]GAB97191.1 hypothetical protein KILIM_059_00100 [Kineosphaera limosa NBRC 100340]
MGRMSDFFGLNGGTDPQHEIARLNRRVTALEATVREVCKQTGIDPRSLPQPQRPHQEVLDLLRSGKKIQAVKRYRELTGAGLREAKEAVDEIEAGGGGGPRHL